MEKSLNTQENSSSIAVAEKAQEVKPSLWISCPDHDFRICRSTFVSLLKFAWWCFGEGIRFHIAGPSGDSLVSRLRNVAVSEFMCSDFSHFMFVDSDIGFEPEAVKELLLSGRDVICGCYPKKCDTTEWPFNFSLTAKMVSDVATDGHLMELRDAPTGFLMVRRHVFERMFEAYPERRCVFGPKQTVEERKNSFDVFSTFIDTTGQYLSEDYGFCRLWEKLGGKVWLDPRIALTHFGGKIYDHGSPLVYWQTQTAQSIQGWTEPDELGWLMNMSSGMDSVVEVGSWKGRSTYALCSGCRGLVYAVDHWKGSESERQRDHLEASIKDVYQEFMKNVGHFPNLRAIRMDSVEAAMQSPVVDMVWIDGGHEYEEVCADISAWLPKARRLICGHDINLPDVARAVGEKLPGWTNPIRGIWAYEIPCQQ